MAITAAQAAKEVLARRQAEAGVAGYISYMELGFAPAAHHRLLLSKLEAVERGEIPRLMINMPPGSAKSTYASRIFPAYYLGKHPERNVLACSHTFDLARDFGGLVRNLFSSQAHHNVFSVGVSQESGAQERWATTAGGIYLAAGVGSAIAGRRGHLGIIDDPVENAEAADSETKRNRAWVWYLNDFLPRLFPTAAQILIMTRWHEDDLAGRILEREAKDWDVVSLPMEAMPGDLLGRKVGERLWPEWFTEDQVDRAKMNVRSWNALYQQQPASEEGDYFKAAWFAEYTELPSPRVVYGASDYAVTDGAGDYTEHGVFAIDQWRNVYVLDWWSGQTAADIWIERQCDFIIQYEPECWFGEAGPIRRATEGFLNRRMEERGAYCQLEWLPSISEKTSRARPFQAMASMGKVFLPKNARWKADLVGQLTRFPAGKFDDKVDTCGLLGRGMESLRAPKRLRRKADEFRAPMEPGEGQQQWLAS